MCSQTILKQIDKV